ncbi:MAG: 30S ribosomal protein S21 [Candidatus Buchananbacteria bacterium RIFCSPHIGHO2_01_FULL_47_11b]|uniref:Small ribosomal subunit protein bS21 n=1 Tax=Candidatus Buchananbacteria bacterium RIFCSPHIGHO2_01_FULL_47_11b TaxID=1797537 RepID=A0A1G1Y501_9BACT|nr:MAG: 30S ribosomal protein S21 [Candidatus Buchananbacteria bacterium RIFCSPHIGHO2_01_FULL_47_11b]
MTEIKRKKGETFESLLRRFSKKLQQSGKLIQTRKNRYYEKPKNRTKRKEDALRRKDIGEKREYLKKTGQLKEEPRTGYGRKSYR